MAVLRIESETLLLADPTLSRSTAHVVVTHPSSNEEAARGKLILVVWLDSKDPGNHEIIAGLIDELRSGYYGASETDGIEEAFEAGLQKANTRLHRFITDGAVGWLERFHAIVAAVRHDVIVLSHVGRMHASLFRESRITDIIRESAATEKLNPLKIFSSVLIGHLQPNDRMLLSTPSLLDYFSLEKLKRIMSDRLPSEAVVNLESVLTAQPTHVTFGAVLLAFLPEARLDTPLTEGVVPFRQMNAPERSLDDLLAKERATERLLSPSLLPNVGELAAGWISRLGFFIRTVVFRRPPKRRVQRTIQDSSRYRSSARSSTIRPRLHRLGIQILLFVLEVPRWIWRLFRRSKGVTKTIRQVPNRTTSGTQRFVRWFRHLNLIQRSFLAAAILALFILSQAVISLSGASARRDREAEAGRTVSQIEENLRRASAAMTYDDYPGAARLLTETETLINALAKRTRAEKQRDAELRTDLDSVREKARRIVRPKVDTVRPFNDALAGARPTGLAIVNGRAVITTNQPTAVTFSLTDLEGSITTMTEASPSRFIIAQDNQSALAGTENSELALLTPSRAAVTPITVSFPNVDRSIVAGSIFQSRLYLLDVKNNGILRHARTGSSYGPGQPWLQSGDVRNGTGIAVDGSIYVSTSSGSINRYTAGESDSATFETIDPPLSSPTHLWTSPTAEQLFVLEPSQQRLLVYRKSSGQLISQFVDDAIGQARGLAVDESNQRLFAVTDDRLIAFSY